MANLPNWISSLPIQLQYAIAVLLGLSAIGISIIGIIKWIGGPMFHNFWPSMEDWTAICKPWDEGYPNKDAPELDADRPLHRPGDRWCQMRNMKTDDYYRIDMQKERVISRVKLRCPHRYPKKYKIEIESDNDSAQPEFIGEFMGPIDYKFQKPRKFRVIQFTITEPDIPEEGRMHSWCVYEVRFWEVRLSKWLTWRIKVKN